MRLVRSGVRLRGLAGTLWTIEYRAAQSIAAHNTNVTWLVAFEVLIDVFVCACACVYACACVTGLAPVPAVTLDA